MTAVDQTTAFIAFGDRALPKLDRELNDTDVTVIQRALIAVCDLFRHVDKIAPAIENGMPRTLCKLLSTSKDNLVKIKATEALVHLASSSIGRSAIVDFQIFPVLFDMVSDENEAVRVNVHTVFERVSNQVDGATSVIQMKYIANFLDILSKESDSVKVIILDILHNCMRIDYQQVASHNGMVAFVGLLQANHAILRARAARNVMDLSFPPAGKESALASGAVPALVKLCTDPESDVRTWAVGGLMSIAITTPGKFAIIDAGGLNALPSLLDDQENTILYSIKMITSLAVAPVARANLQSILPKLQSLLKFKGSRLDAGAVARHAQKAIDAVTWTP